MPLARELLPIMYAISGVVRDRAQPDLTMRQLCLLMHLADKDKAQSWSVKEAAAALEIHKPAVTRAVERLREFGLATSKTDPKDRRCVVLNITQRGLGYLGRMSKQAALIP